MSHQSIVTDKTQASYDRFHFSAGVQSGDTLYCSGVIGTGPDGKPPSDVQEEFRLAWKAAGEVLSAAGMGYENIVEYTTYHVGLQGHMRDFMRVRDEFLNEPWPAWTAIGITELAVPGAHVEIRITARK